MNYQLLDSGHSRKLEQFGPYRLIRPCGQALWRPQAPQALWESADATFTREPDNQWVKKRALPIEWTSACAGLNFKIAPTEFGHLGLFPEHSLLWNWMTPLLAKKPGARFLNLFAYSGGASLAAARVGAKVCHLDASKGMVAWARENAALNQLEGAPIRWIVDDASKFLARELRRGARYEAILLDPPSFGRGSRGEIFKVEKDLEELLSCCVQLLSDEPIFLALSSHTHGMTPIAMGHILSQWIKKQGQIETGELTIQGTQLALPSGTYARWYSDV
jgi:23S rRNA (cytosine1962-C5)-methyltransferase